MSKRKYHRDNCDCFIRETVTDIYGRTIILGGKHAFEYSITIVTKYSMTTTRYPNGKEFVTGYNFENWHYRYVGVNAATIIVTENITFEEYYAYYVKK
jgi:hypothetical protein